MPTSGALPDGYHEVLSWRVTEKRIRVVGLTILSVPLFVVSALIFLNLAITLGKLPSRLEFGLGEIGLMVAGILLALILHELTHGLVMQMYGAKPKYGVLWRQMMFYATSPGYAYRRNNYIGMALAPLFALSVLVILGMWLLSGTFWVFVFGVCGVINVSGAVGDMWITLIVLRYAAPAYVMDERDGIRVFLPKP
jgi:hypothetical protein